MTLNIETPPLKMSVASTVGAVILATILVIPGYFLGGLVSWVYMFFTAVGMNRYGGFDGEFHTWIPFLNGILTVFWFYILPDGIRGLVGTAGALFASNWVFKRADMGKVTFTVTGIWVTITALLLCLSLYTGGPDIRQFSLVGIIIGLLFGAFTFASNRN